MGRTTSFLVCPNLSYQRGTCFSCGNPIGDRYGRCWRCSLAWRVVVGVPISGVVVDDATRSEHEGPGGGAPEAKLTAPVVGDERQRGPPGIRVKTTRSGVGGDSRTETSSDLTIHVESLRLSGVMSMPSFRDAFPSKYLKAEDLSGPVAVVIEAVVYEDVGAGQRQQRKLVAHFMDWSKGLVLNLINGETIAEIIGTEDYERWLGQTIELYPTKTEYQGKRVPCIRVREAAASAPATSTRAPTPKGGTSSGEVAF